MQHNAFCCVADPECEDQRYQDIDDPVHVFSFRLSFKHAKPSVVNGLELEVELLSMSSFSCGLLSLSFGKRKIERLHRGYKKATFVEMA